MRLRNAAPAALALALALGPAVALAGSAEIRALDDFFAPRELRAPVGAEVTWTNDGENTHTVAADDGSFASGNLEPGERFIRRFTEPAVVRYFCEIHGAAGGLGMSGTVVIGDADVAEEPEPAIPPPPPGEGKTIQVPQDVDTIGDAAAIAEPGDLILVSPGVYAETVQVTTPYLTIRGTDRNRVILEGKFFRLNGIQVLEADGVAIENMTARHYQVNGFYWRGVTGYRGSYLTAYNNGDYGIYAFDSVRGQLDHSYASGHPDAGFYIGQCRPCHAVITDVLSENNALGYSGTNASGDLIIAESEWRNNMAGIVPNTLDSETLPPQGDIDVVGNWVHDNNNERAPAQELTYPSLGTGILLGGGIDNRVSRNLVEDHESYGIAVVTNLDENVWPAAGNRVEDNVVRGSGLADLALGAPAGGENCFAGNDFATSAPPAIQTTHGCGVQPLGGGGGDLAVTVSYLGRFADAEDGDFPGGDWQTQPAPPPQPNMPNAAAAPPAPATGVPTTIDPEGVPVPEGDGRPRDVNPEVTVLGVSLAAPTWWSLLISVYGYVLPLILYAAWISVAFWDLIRREDLSQGSRVGWMAGVLLVPLLGPIAYFAVGRSPIPAALRATLVGGGALVYVGFAVGSYLVAST